MKHKQNSSNAKDVLLSVIIPIYNTEQYLKECLDSVVNQTLRDIEIICIDDKSTDNSAERILSFAFKPQNYYSDIFSYYYFRILYVKENEEIYYHLDSYHGNLCIPEFQDQKSLKVLFCSILHSRPSE